MLFVLHFRVFVRKNIPHEFISFLGAIYFRSYPSSLLDICLSVCLFVSFCVY